MLSCEEITDLLTDYAEGNLSSMDRIPFQVELLRRFERWKSSRS